MTELLLPTARMKMRVRISGLLLRRGRDGGCNCVDGCVLVYHWYFTFVNGSLLQTRLLNYRREKLYDLVIRSSIIVIIYLSTLTS